MAEVLDIPLTCAPHTAGREMSYRYVDDIPIPESIKFFQCEAERGLPPHHLVACSFATDSKIEFEAHLDQHAHRKERKRMDRVRTEPSPEFVQESAGRMRTSREFAEESGGRTRVSEEFGHDGGGLPVERFMPPHMNAGSPSGRPDPLAWAQQKMREAERQEFTPLGQVSQAIVGDRDIDFGKVGPLLGFTQKKELLIATPVMEMPFRRVLVNRRGKPIWNVEKMDERARARELPGSSVTVQKLTLTSYAESGKYHGFYVIQPLTQLLFTTADPARRLIFINFYPGTNGNYPVLLFDAQTNRLTIWGGGGYTFA